MTPAIIPVPASKPSKRKSESAWTPQKSSELYGVETWGHGFFGVNKKGHVTVRLEDDEAQAEVSLFEVIDGLRDRGTHLPVLLRLSLTAPVPYPVGGTRARPPQHPVPRTL